MLEGLAASGLRSIRYALEIDGISRIDANDLDGSVVEVGYKSEDKHVELEFISSLLTRLGSFSCVILLSYLSKTFSCSQSSNCFPTADWFAVQ